MLPDIDSLRCFVAAAKLLNFRSAARSVALTPTAFGQRIKQLEGQLGAPLFRRSTRHVELTDAGLTLLPRAQRCIDAAIDCLRVGRDDTPAMDVVVGTRHELGLSWLLPQLDALAEAQPKVAFHLVFGSTRDLLSHVRAMEIDCAVTSARFTDPKLDALRLHREDYAFVASPRLLARRRLRRVADLAAHTLLDTDAELPLFRYFRDFAPAAEAARFVRVEHLGTIEAIRRRALAGAGVAVLPEYLIREDLAKKRLLRVLPRAALGHDYFRLVFRADDARRGLFEAMAAVMLEHPLR
jgi:DNA-binding transcriptional LysR family regulator